MDYNTDEEQVEALKRWWQENGKSILVGIGLALALIYGWKAWQSYQQSIGEAASNIYFDLLDASALAQENPDEINTVTVSHLVDQLKAEYGNSNYALYAALLAAKQAVLNNDLPTAEQQLKWVFDRSDEGSSIHLITRLRLARVIVAQGGEGSAERALALIETIQAGSHTTAYEEVKGDIYLETGRTDEARAAYQKALAEAVISSVNRPLLTLKLNDLAKNGDS